MKKQVITAAAGLILAMSASSEAHFAEGVQFFAVQFPDEAIPTVDGDLSDWAIVPATYAYGNDVMLDARGLTPEGWTHADWDPTDFNMRHFIGWNDSEDEIYAATSVFDDEHNRDQNNHWSEDDDWEITIDPLHQSLEEQRDGVDMGMIQYATYVPPLDGAWNEANMRPEITQLDWYASGTQFYEVAWTWDGAELGESTYYYEGRFKAIQDIPVDSPQPGDVVFASLDEDQIIHLDITMIDNDGPENSYRTPGCCGYWSTVADCCEAQNDWVLTQLDDELLDNIMTAVEIDSWGRIKSQFK